jgi:hypothetical protein
MPDKTKALEAWRRPVRDLDATTPWTAEWLRARMIEENRRLAYHALVDDTYDFDGTDIIDDYGRRTSMKDAPQEDTT